MRTEPHFPRSLSPSRASVSPSGPSVSETLLYIRCRLYPTPSTGHQSPLLLAGTNPPSPPGYHRWLSRGSRVTWPLWDVMPTDPPRRLSSFDKLVVSTLPPDSHAGVDWRQELGGPGVGAYGRQPGRPGVAGMGLRLAWVGLETGGGRPWGTPLNIGPLFIVLPCCCSCWGEEGGV